MSQVCHAITQLWTNRREEAQLRKYKLSAIQAEMEFAHLERAVMDSQLDDEANDDQTIVSHTEEDVRCRAVRNAADAFVSAQDITTSEAASISTGTQSATTPVKEAAKPKAPVVETTFDVSNILTQELAFFRDTFNIPRDEPLVSLCRAKLRVEQRNYLVGLCVYSTFSSLLCSC